MLVTASAAKPAAKAPSPSHWRKVELFRTKRNCENGSARRRVSGLSGRCPRVPAAVTSLTRTRVTSDKPVLVYNPWSSFHQLLLRARLPELFRENSKSRKKWEHHKTPHPSRA